MHKWRRICLLIFFFIFFIFFYLFTQLETDSDVPQFFPKGSNYREFGQKLADNFADDNVYQVTTNIVWGIEGIDRSGTDETLIDDIGTVIYSSNISFFSYDEQKYLAQFCDDLLCLYSNDYKCRYTDETYIDLKIADPAIYGDSDINVVKCFMTEFREWVLTDSAAKPNQTEIANILEIYNRSGDVSFDGCIFDGTFPVEGESCSFFLFAFIWLNEYLPTSNPDYTAGTTNYDYWKSNIWATDRRGDEVNVSSSSTVYDAELRFFTVTVLLDSYSTTAYQDGIKLFENLQLFLSDWSNDIDGVVTTDKYGDTFVSTPSTLKTVMTTDYIVFAYYYLQENIIEEAFVGIVLSLSLAFIVLTVATNNWLMAAMSIWVIFCIVICVMGYTVAMGWKLGVIEAVIYVMVVGMSVDYVVHLSEAYLSSSKYYRTDRTQKMLGIVGGSVLSGAASTLIGIMWLFFAIVQTFFKFGAFIFFLISVSVSFSLFGFTAAMTTFGPEGSRGDVVLCIKRCIKCCRKLNNRHVQNNKDTNQLEMG